MKNMKRIHKVVIKRMIDETPDTSWLGEYSNREESEFTIDRAHDLDCLCQPYNRISGDGARILESAQQYLISQHDASFEDEDMRVWYDDGDSFISAMLAGDAEEFCLGSCVSHWSNREYRYFNPSGNYKDETRENTIKYVSQDYTRMESLNRGDWCFIGVRAEARYSVGESRGGYVEQEITSGGLWGVESDSDASYFAEIEQEELANLRTQLSGIGFSKRAIATAFKNIEHENV